MNEQDRETQELKGNYIGEDIPFIPNRIRRFFTDNFFQRTISRLVALTSDNKSKMLRCSSAGVLYVSNSGGGLETNETVSGTAVDAYGVAIKPTVIAKVVEVFISNNPATIKRSNNLLAYNNEISLGANSYYKFEASTAMINIKNTNAGDDANYQIVFWY